ncbi:MAG: protein translocase subunit SecD [Candidatus Pacebacteria bacterium]|nr:protein translocase subunit SecD [Candidatus Paceibacterota bacterium]
MTKNANKSYLIIVICFTILTLLLAFPRPVNDFLNYLNVKFIPHLPERPFKLGLDLQGGSQLLYEADASNIGPEGKKEAMQGLRDVIERRVNMFGVTEAVVSTQESGESQRLSVELPGVKDINEAIEMIGKTPYLEFKEERPASERDALLQEQNGEDPYFIPTRLTGQYLKKATLSFNQSTMAPEVLLEFNDEGAAIFKDLTEKNIGKKVAIYIDNVMISSPVVQEAISGGSAQITGTFSIAQARELVRNLNAGALPLPIKLISQTTVGPTLGKTSLHKSLTAGFLGLLGICIFMLVFYRFSGLFACLSLVTYVGILLCLFKFVPVTLTLAGIGGAILSVGMAVDANILIFERMKEERRRGESFQKSLELGFSRAWPSIRDSNFTTLLIAVIMFGFGSSFVKGFALALSLGILTSMFSAMFVTRVWMNIFSGTRLENMKRLWF